MKPDATTTAKVPIAVRGKRRQHCSRQCRWLGPCLPHNCELFWDDNGPGVWLEVESYGKGRPLRCPQCLAAEVKP